MRILMQALRTIIDTKDLPSLSIPEEFGTKVEVIILPIENQLKEDVLDASSEKINNIEKQFLNTVYLNTIEEDSQEDSIWKKYQ